MEEAPRRDLETLQRAIDVGRELTAGTTILAVAAALGVDERTVHRLKARRPALMAGIGWRGH